MKNKIAYLLFFVGVVAAAGCNKKFLEDMKSYDKFDESIFTNEAQTGFYIDRMYNYYFVSYRNPMQTVVGLYNDTRRNITEDVGGNVHYYIKPNKNLNQASQADGYYGTTLGSNVPNNPYTRIRNANFLLEKIDGIGQVLPEGFRNTAKGQMFFFRALQYFDLVRVYGGVPIELEVHNASTTDESIRTPRAKTSEVFDQIIKDFDSAALLLPMKWTATAGTDYGRFTAAAALAMKSRVLLTAASPLFNPNWDNAGDARWQKALDASLAAETALTAAGYGGSINTAKDWGEITTKFDNDKNLTNGEGILVILLSNTTTSTGTNSNWENSIRPRDHNGGGGISVPKGMLDLFPKDDGSRPTAANGYNDTFFFEKRDPRFYRTFAFSGSKWTMKEKPNKGTWLYRWRENATKTAVYFGNNQVSSPAVVRKMSNPAADSTALAFSGTDIFDYRYGELLLNIAECYAAKGDIGNCVNYLRKIRQRVYPSSASANNYGIGTPADRYAALEAVLYERRVELAYEGKRFWDIQRWMLYADDAATGDNTNAKLGIPVINGTNRSGYYWQFKTFSKDDQLTDADRNISIDPDASSFADQIKKLKDLYNAKFVMTPLDQPMDRDGNNAVNILFRQNYYISGLQPVVLSNNAWLPQTVGWQDYNGAMGTFDYKQ
jgi:starch-binding outer membrane protein, SusD/RagB family